MKAMILAAGKGTRVRPLTYELPKPMIPILGKPVMEYLVEHLARHGIREIMVNTSHLSNRIERYFGDGRRFGVEIGYSFEGYVEGGDIIPFALGSAGGMKKIQDFGGFFDATTLVLCGDAILDLDIASAVAEHKSRRALVSLVATQVARDKVSDYGVVLTDERDKIISFQEKPAQAEARSDWVNTGVYIFEPQALDLIPSGQVFDIGADLFPLLVNRQLPFYALRQSFHWIDIGKVSDYWSAVNRVMRQEVTGISMPGTEIRPGVWAGLNTRADWDAIRVVGPVYLGSGCRIEPGCEIIGPAWIGHGCHVHSGARIIQSIIFEHTRVPAGMELKEQIVCGDYCVSRDGHVLHISEPDLPWRWSDARMKLNLDAAV